MLVQWGFEQYWETGGFPRSLALQPDTQTQLLVWNGGGGDGRASAVDGWSVLVDNTTYRLYCVGVQGRGYHYILSKGGEHVSVPVHAGKDLGKGLLHALLKKAGLK